MTLKTLERNMIITPKEEHDDVPDIEMVRRDVQTGKEEMISSLNISIDELQNVALMNNPPIMEDGMSSAKAL